MSGQRQELESFFNLENRIFTQILEKMTASWNFLTLCQVFW